SFNQQSWNIRNNIPGEPNVDYPVYSAPPISSFSCKGRHYGYYADVESRCQVFRVCAQTDLTGTGFAFLCPNGTLFNQKFFVCDWYKNVDCAASETYYSRNNLFGTKMGLMSENDMMTMVQGMVDYTKQRQFNNQNVNNNGGFPFTNSQFPKQSDNSQSVINQNNGLASSGNGNFPGQQSGANQGRSNSNVQPPQRGSDILSQPIFPSENNRLTTPGRAQGTSSFPAPTAVPDATRYNQNANLNSNNFAGANNENNNQQPTLFVSSLGEISSDQNLRLNPFTTAIVSTRTYNALSSNVDPVSTSAAQVQRLALQGQYNQLNGNTQSNVQYNTGNGLNNPVSLQQEINHLSESGSNEPNLSQQSSPSSTPNKFEANTGPNPASNSQSDQTLTAVYSGSGDLLSHTISQYSKPTNVQGPAQNFGNGRDPSLSALVNSLGETIYTPIFSGEGNLLSHTIGQKASSENGNDSKPQSKPDAVTTVGKQGIPVSTPQPRLQTPFFESQSRVTIPPFSTSSTGSNVKENTPKTNVVHSGQGNLLSQTISPKGPINQSPQSSQSSNVYSAENKLSSQSVQQKNIQTSPSQGDRKATTSFTSSNRFAGNQNTVPNQGTSTGSGSSHSPITSVPSTPSYGQKPITTLNARTNQATTYNSHVSFGQKLSTNSVPISTTSAPYSPSVPPFRSTTATVYTPTASSYHQHTQTYNDQSHRSRSYTQQENGQSVFSNNQFQVPSKEYLPSSDNTRTARTNELSLGNHGSSQNNFNQRDGRQQFTYPVDQTDSKTLDNTNDLPNLGADADPKKQNLINRDVTHIDKYLYRNQIEQPKNETGEPTVTTSERNPGIKLSAISIRDIFYLNKVLQDGGKSEDITSEDLQLSTEEQDLTGQTSSELTDFKLSPIIVAPISDGASNDIEDNEALRNFDKSANLLFAGLQLSLHEEKELSDSEIKNELNDEIFRSQQDVYETKIRNPKDVYSSGGGLKQSNSIKLIFERAKNRSNNFRVKLKSRTEEENKAKRTFALPPSTAEEKLVTILKPLLRNITVTPNRYVENNTKIGGFINNDLKSSIGEPRQRHSLAPRILFKNVKTIEDIERIATAIDSANTEDDELTSETKLSNRIAFPDSVRSHTNTKIDSKTTSSSIEPVEAMDTEWSYYTKTKLFPQRNQHRPIRDHETAASNQHSYTYSTGQAQQASQQTYSTYNQYNSYPQQHQQQQLQPQQQQQQQQQQHSYHYATIENRPNPSQASFQAPPLQSNYPASIQNNPQSQSSYPSVDNRYIPSAPLPVPSSIPSSLPSIVHPTSQYSTQQVTSFATNQHNIPRTTSNEKVVVNVIPATGWYLNDPNERQSFLDAVSRGLLSEKGFVYVNNVQGSQQQQSNFNAQEPQGRSQIDIDEEAFFHGSSSYESPLNSVGKLPGDSDSVSAFLNSFTSSPVTPSSSSSSSPSSGYRYEHPRRSFDV
ncbi:hypothetical protein HA402_003066, partial [Bradysia odoriphaga]